MNESDRLRTLTAAIQLLNDAGSWTGRTHIQKFLFLSRELLGFDAGYDFVLYQRGPYSFDLDSDVRTVRSVGAIDIEPMGRYGPTYRATPAGRDFSARAPMNQVLQMQMTQLANLIGEKTASDLELLATTLFVREEGKYSAEEIAERVAVLKPHFTKAQVLGALAELAQIEVRLRPNS